MYSTLPAPLTVAVSVPLTATTASPTPLISTVAFFVAKPLPS